MQQRAFGTTGLRVSALGFGAGSIGGDDLTDAEATRLLHQALDEGITLFDTARSYGRSEARLGAALRGREDIVVSTKVGYGVSGVTDWTAEAVTRGIEEARVRLQRDVIELVHLHSCPPGVMAGEPVLEALAEAREAGWIRLTGYAGDNEGLAWALEHGVDCAVASANVFDQGFMNHGLGVAKQRGVGIIAKRPLGNAAWRFSEQPVGQYCEGYWHRLRAMALDFGDRWHEVALRFAAFTWGIDSVIAGTRSAGHLAENARCIRLGPLPQETVDHIRGAWRAAAHDWRGET